MIKTITLLFLALRYLRSNRRAAVSVGVSQVLACASLGQARTLRLEATASGLDGLLPRRAWPRRHPDQPEPQSERRGFSRRLDRAGLAFGHL